MAGFLLTSILEGCLFHHNVPLYHCELRHLMLKEDMSIWQASLELRGDGEIDGLTRHDVAGHVTHV